MEISYIEYLEARIIILSFKLNDFPRFSEHTQRLWQKFAPNVILVYFVISFSYQGVNRRYITRWIYKWKRNGNKIAGAKRKRANEWQSRSSEM